MSDLLVFPYVPAVGHAFLAARRSMIQLSMSMGRSSDRSLERLAAGVIMVGFPGRIVPPEVQALAVLGVRNFVLFASNAGDREQVRALTAQLQRATGGTALIAVDHEGGRVMRLHEATTPWPSAMAWCAAGDRALVSQAARVSAQELRSLGININFAPVADLLGDHRNPVLGTRCFSDDPNTVAEFVATVVAAHRDGGCVATCKHFPGHGFTPVDSHLDLPLVDRDAERLLEVDLVPFCAGIREGVECLMVSHVWYSQLDPEPTPASMSPSVVRLARDVLQYEGVIVSDCLEMGAIQGRMTSAHAAVRAIAAGVDLAIFSHRIDRQREALTALVRAVQNGSLPLERLQEANERLARLRDRVIGTSEAPYPDGGMDLAREIALRAVTLVRDRDQLLPLSSNDSPIGVVDFGSKPASEVEDDEPLTALGVQVRRRGLRIIQETVDDGADGIERTLRRLDDVETVLVGTTRAEGSPQQADLIGALLARDKRVVVVALREPFDLLAFPDAPCYLTSYGAGETEINAVLAVIFGDESPRGRLPVTLPGLYSRGHGIRWVDT